MKIVYTQECLNFYKKGHPESPQRVRKAAEFLRNKGYDFVVPDMCREEDLLRVHDKSLVKRVKRGSFSSVDCPDYENIYYYARLSAGGAIKAADINGFSLMRPPGHHATTDNVGGFCYFNSISVAVSSVVGRVLIVDIDRHHGNGTEDIFRGSDHVEYISLHGPGYPGTGTESYDNCHNHVFRNRTSEEEYLEVLDTMLKGKEDFDILAVSAGFDTHEEDPLGSQIDLSTEFYRTVGKRLGELEIPTFCVLEGGYSPGNMGKSIHQFIKGLGSSPKAL